MEFFKQLKCLVIVALAVGTASTTPVQAFQQYEIESTKTMIDYIDEFIDRPNGAVDWKELGKTEEILVKGKTPEGYDSEYTKPDFTQEIEKLDGKTINIKGYMFPLEQSEEQRLFLLGPFPQSCPFHYHVGPSLIIEAHAKENPVKFSYEPVTLSGTLELVQNDPEHNVFYRLKDLKQIN